MIATQAGSIGIQGGAHADILTPDAVRFLVSLSTRFESRRRQLIEARRTRQAEFDSGVMPDFPPQTAEIRKTPWKVAPSPADLLDRRVEMVGATGRKSVLSGLNSGASVFVADFEDSNSPTWDNMLEGQLNLRDAVNGTLTYTDPDGNGYELSERPAVLMVRPRGWHLDEKHFLVRNEPISASLFDCGLYLFHNAKTLIRNGTAPYFYLPKLEDHQEARLWNDVFCLAQEYLGISQGTIRATVTIGTLPAAFEMDEILWELRHHAAGLSWGRRDYLFSYIKTFREHPQRLLPDGAQIGMSRYFLHSCVDLLVSTCHRRGTHAMGDVAAQTPVHDDARANAAALAQLRDDMLRVVWAGHDGTQVAHPALVPLARFIFDTYMPFPNQLDRLIQSETTAADLLAAPNGSISEAGVAENLDAALQYLAAWLRGNGCVPVHHLKADTSTAEFCRAQLWQWIRHGAKMDDGRVVTPSLVSQMMECTLEKLRGRIPERHLHTAAHILEGLLDSSEFQEFLTLNAYDFLD